MPNVNPTEIGKGVLYLCLSSMALYSLHISWSMDGQKLRMHGVRPGYPLFEFGSRCF